MAYVLVVDDDTDFATATAVALREAGHDPAILNDLEAADVCMAARRPDLLILDLGFPQGHTEGLLYARTIRNKRPELSGMPVLVVSAINSALNLGIANIDCGDDWLPVSGFLDKPVDLTVLVDTVDSLLRGTPEVAASSV